MFKIKSFLLTSVQLLFTIVLNAQTIIPKVKLMVAVNKDSITACVLITDNLNFNLPVQTIFLPKGTSYPVTGFYTIEKKYKNIYREQIPSGLFDTYPLSSPSYKTKNKSYCETINEYFNLGVGDYRIKATVFFSQWNKKIKDQDSEWVYFNISATPNYHFCKACPDSVFIAPYK